MEENIEILLNHVDNREECINSIMLQLASSLCDARHEGGDCSSFKRKLETLSVVIKCSSKHDEIKNNENMLLIEGVVDMCFETLCSLEDGKDLCIPVICDVLCCSLLLLPENYINEKITSIIHRCKSQLTEFIMIPSLMCEHSQNFSVEVTKLGINLRMWESIIVVIVSWKHMPGYESRRTIFLDLVALFDDEFFRLLLKLISFEHDVLTSQTLLCLIPKLVALTESISIVEYLWNYITNIFSSMRKDYKVTPHMFLIMCALSDFFIPCGYDVPYSFPLGQNNDFWRILQYGLVSCDALMRKQALYLLKRAVEQESTVISVELAQSNLFLWNCHETQHFQKAWNELFLLLEVLEEKQMHLIEPVQPVLGSLIRACQKSFIHSSWVLCIVLRALRHECNAVVKWGIVSMTNDVDLIVNANSDYLFVLTSFLNALNSSSLYIMNSSNLSLPDIVVRLRSFFVTISKSQLDVRQLIFKNLVYAIVRVSWGPVALFYVVYALAGVPKCPILGINDLEIVRSFLVDALGTQVVHIRGAVQSFFIDALINLSDEHQLQIDTIADIIGIFKRTEALKRGSQTWCRVTSWIKSFIKEEDAFQFTWKTFNSIINGDLEYEKRAAARMIVLLSDADLIRLDVYNTCCKYSLSSVLLSIVEYFKNYQERMYVCHTKQNTCLEMLVSLLEESQPITENDLTGKHVLSLIYHIIPGTFYCVKMTLLRAYNLECFDTVNLYLQCLNIFVQEPRLLSDILKHSEIIQDASFTIMDSESEISTPISKYFSIKILTWISDLINRCTLAENVVQNVHTAAVYKKHMLFSEKILQWKNLNQILIKTKQDQLLTRDMQTLWGRIVSEYMQGIWSLLNLYIEMQMKLSELNVNPEFASHVLKEAGEALELGGRGMLIPVMSVVQHIVHQLINYDSKEDIKRFISMCWTGIFELRKSDLFWVAMEKFIKMTFQKCLMSVTEMNETLLMYAQKIFDQGEAVAGLGNILMLQLQEVSKHYYLGSFPPFPKILVQSLAFGPIHRRDRKVDDETCAFIRSLGDTCCINDTSMVCSDTEVRARGIALLLSCEQYVGYDNGKTLAEVVRLLLKSDLQISQQKTRYYADSYHHRYRNRVMQILLLLEPLLPEGECEKLSTYLQQSLLKENHQPSIRYLQEWLLVRLMLKCSCARSQIWSVLKVASETRPGSLCSFISIVFHIARILPEDDGLEEFIDRGMNEILPCTMAQHFNIRLYAQVSFFKLWEYAQERALNSVTEKYQMVYSCIMTSLHSPCNLKNVKRLEGFYFKTFHPLEHYSVQTIFYDLPRLTNVAQEEWISIDVLLLCGIKENTVISLSNKNVDLQDCEPLSSIVKSELIVEEDLPSGDVVNVQKKIIPWKAMVPDADMLLSISETVLRRKQIIFEDGLIVIASLIDRPPNLGGLSRTCEAFGVSQYVLGSIKYMEDKQFQTLSVSAERWISVIEVKPHELPQYLERMKLKGYTVVGAEQTANSVLLHEVKFPKRTILLLGNEKEGVPANLLPLLDVCVEVPQQGVIRSLNVHVTGAIFIWEYARQHNVQHKI